MIAQLGQPPTTAGLTISDLIALLSILVVIFGLLLTAIGVLVLRQFDQQRSEVDRVRKDASEDTAALRAEMNNGFTALWGEFRWLRGFLVGKPVAEPTDTPDTVATRPERTG